MNFHAINFGNHTHRGSSQQLFTMAQPLLRWESSLPLKPTIISLSNQDSSLQQHPTFNSTRLMCKVLTPTIWDGASQLVSDDFVGLQSYKYSSLRSTSSDDKSSGRNQYVKEGSHGVITYENRFSSDEVEHGEPVQEEPPQEGSPLDVQKRISEFFDQLNAKIANVFVDLPFDTEHSYPFFIYGGAATAALYLASAVVTSIDSIPVFPKVMEVVGLGYTLWFGTRYLIFKRNRDELAAKIEEFKQKVIGPEDD